MKGSHMRPCKREQFDSRGFSMTIDSELPTKWTHCKSCREQNIVCCRLHFMRHLNLWFFRLTHNFIIIFIGVSMMLMMRRKCYHHPSSRL